MSSPAVLQAVEKADLVIDAGGVCFHDINTGVYSQQIAADKFITIGIDYVRIGEQVFNPVQMGDLLTGLTKALRKNFGYKVPARSGAPSPAAIQKTRSQLRRCTSAIATSSDRTITLS